MRRQHQQRRQRRRLRLAALLAAAVVAACQGPAAAAPTSDDARDYVVVFKRGFDASRVRALCDDERTAAVGGGRFRGLCRRRFSAVLNGFAGALSAADVEALREAFPSSIDYIERDASFSITGEAQPDWLSGEGRLLSGAHAAARRRLASEARRSAARHAAAASRRRRLPEQAGASWALDRIDQAGLPLDGLYHYDATGSGVNVYVLDTGIRFTHTEFRSLDGSTTVRARHGFSVFDDNNSTDCNGHGTHTAATVGGVTYGVAKNVTLWAVRAMNCQGDAKVSAILASFEWIAENAVQPAVVSMSVAGDMSPAVNEAARRLVEDRGIPLVVAAGNSYESACLMSPASSPWAISVAASDNMDRRWAKGNWGPCVDVHAPGVGVTSAVSTSDTATLLKTGTSMATPHVAGVVALYLERHPGASPTEVRQKVNAAATPGVITDDPEGWGTWDPYGRPGQVDISLTPNRLLRTTLLSQASLQPGVLTVDPAAPGPMPVSLALNAAPTADVTISVSAPTASWASASLATLSPPSLFFTATSWSTPQTLTVQASPDLVDGNYYINLQFTSADSRFNGAVHSLRVLDSRPPTGDSMAAPRVIAALPFTDTDVSSRFTDKYLYASGDPATGAGAPDVVYSFTPTTDMAVDISTCGSLYDTKLYVFEDPSNLQVYVGNDDDPSCTTNPKASRLSTTLQAGLTVYIVVDGYSGAWLDSQGLYTLAREMTDEQLAGLTPVSLRTAVEQLPRRALQQLAKKQGQKANQKSDVLARTLFERFLQDAAAEAGPLPESAAVNPLFFMANGSDAADEVAAAVPPSSAAAPPASPAAASADAEQAAGAAAPTPRCVKLVKRPAAGAGDGAADRPRVAGGKRKASVEAPAETAPPAAKRAAARKSGAGAGGAENEGSAGNSKPAAPAAKPAAAASKQVSAAAAKPAAAPKPAAAAASKLAKAAAVPLPAGGSKPAPASKPGGSTSMAERARRAEEAHAARRAAALAKAQGRA
ncbi:peptidase S8 [Micractinium conductrix]|uniref:Peptidase S8 n=1 Tax=Micractinium conductrix TaxID=554055 RepID=A0A2P6V5H8_9CHLO|nr:peptidase S8 [Micractinium conductrix]|eukprot:PSC69339.1 peptidase S8 [Micractinium conductrix]